MASDPWVEAAKQYKAQPQVSQGEAAPADWKIWQNNAEAEQPGLLENLGHSIGIGKEESEQRQQQMAEHPIRTMAEDALGPAYQVGKGILGGLKRSGGDLLHAGQSMREGNPAQAGLDVIDAVPIAGPAMMKMTEEAPVPASDSSKPYFKRAMAAATPGNIGTGLGTAMQIAPMALGAADTMAPDRPLLAQIPSRARAGNTLQEIRQQMTNVPVAPNETMAPLSRFQELTQRGGSTSKPATQLSARLRSLMVPAKNTAPFNFPEARDFYSNISGQSAEDLSRLNPQMRRQMGEVRAGMHNDLTNAADTIGRGADYSDAVKEYAKAMQMRKALITASKYAIPTFGAGLLGKILYDRIPAR